MRYRVLLPAIALACGATLGLDLHTSSAAPAHAAAGPVTFAARDHGYDGPDRIPAGMTTVEIINRGRDLHHAQLVKIPAGKTAADFRAAIKASPMRFPEWASALGGPNAVAPGGRAAATMRLEAGRYLMLCLIPDRHGVPHVALGMEKEIAVTQAQTVSLVEPSPDATITLHDFRFAAPEVVEAGSRTLQVMNHGSQTHEVVLVKLDPGASVGEFLVAMAPGAAGPPPGRTVGGIVGLDRGGRGFFTADLAPGQYGLICFFEDETGAPHFSKGMATQFTVR